LIKLQSSKSRIMKLTDGEALTSAAASHYHHPTMALVLKHNMPAIMLKLRMSSPRTQDGRIKIQEPLAIACLCPKVPRAQVQDPKEPLEISVQRSQGPWQRSFPITNVQPEAP